MFIVRSLLFLLVAVKLPQVNANVFCLDDTFEAVCQPGEVILITSAIYGRLEINKCISNNHGHMGCHSDSLTYVDHMCSGRRRCSFKIFDNKKELYGIRYEKKCPSDLEHYLKVEYKCIPVIQADTSQCYSEGTIPVNIQTGYMTSAVTDETKEGSAQCPYTFNIDSGRKLDLTLYNFAKYKQDTGLINGCPVVMKVLSGSNSEPQDVTLCDDVGRGKSIGVFSSPVTVEIVLVHMKTQGNFTIGFNVIGCANLQPRPYTVIVRDDDQLTVTCNTTEEVRNLVCREGQWSGTIQNCPPKKTSGVWGSMGHIGDDEFPVGILIIVAIGVALGVFLGGIMLVAASIHMKKKQEEKRRKLIYMTPPPELSPMGDLQDTLHRDCAQCTIERAAQSPRVKMSTYYPAHQVDGSIKDYSLFEKNSLQDSKQQGSNITSSAKTLQSRSHMYELPSGNTDRNRLT